ncbi:hypothetical protein ACFP1L_09335 [Lactiplantibacillus nangangensis]|uniref:Uncharacterized protein n=1 Tax=Lactiplantibacillus nangangensis TaxID=2559917 RepID=A0ABW1SLC4_9LACO|nr:hypothetical protein [Lactiplantibacillus nangangensis]
MKQVGFVATMMTASLGLGAMMTSMAEGMQIDDEVMVQLLTITGEAPLMAIRK